MLHRGNNLNYSKSSNVLFLLTVRPMLGLTRPPLPFMFLVAEIIADPVAFWGSSPCVKGSLCAI